MSRVLAPIVFGLATLLSGIARADEPITDPVVSQQEVAPETKSETPPVPISHVNHQVVIVQSDPPPPVKTVVIKSEPRHHWGGIDVSVGVPGGIQVGGVFRPYVNWLRLEVGAAHNLMGPGVFGAITLDPMPWAFGITLTGEGGYFWPGPVPFINKPPSVGYEYASIMPGIELGSRNSIRFYLRGGVTWLHGEASGIDWSNKDSSIVLGNPRVDAVIPAMKMGLSIFF